jgi:hypothetical protein
MLKQSILLLAMVPAIAMGHDWDNEYWLERLLRNHVKVGDCLTHIQENERSEFLQNCSVHSMGYTENDVFAEYYEELAKHPEQDDILFIIDHFPPPPTMDSEEYSEIISGILDNIYVRENVNAIIITLSLAEVIIRSESQKDDK